MFSYDELIANEPLEFGSVMALDPDGAVDGEPLEDIVALVASRPESSPR